MLALLIPVTGALEEFELDGTLGQLQAKVDGNIEALNVPEAFGGARATSYVNDEGKYLCLDADGKVQVNWRATDFMVPGVGLFLGDFIAGPFLLCGFNPRTGEHAELPDVVVSRARKIEREAGS